MNKRLFLATTAAVVIATSAFAQSPNTSNQSSPDRQRQQDSTSTSPSSTSTPSSSSGSAQTNSSTSSTQSQSPSSSGQTAGQSSSSGTSTNTTQAPAANDSNQAQTSQPSNQTPSNQAQTNSPSSTTTQSANPPASGANQAQSPTNSGSTTAQQPNNQQNTADRSSNTNVNASVNINDQQRTRISGSISHLNVQPLTNVNFSLSVGTIVPRDIRLQPLPAEVVEIVPQYRGYNFVLVKDEIVIVEPSSYKIVAVLPYSGRSTASAPVRSEQRKMRFSDRDREVIRKHVRAHPVERRTTGSTVRTEIRTGERVPEGVEIEAFPETVYREAPTLREYRYINRDSHTYIVEPRERLIIEEID